MATKKKSVRRKSSKKTPKKKVGVVCVSRKPALRPVTIGAKRGSKHDVYDAVSGRKLRKARGAGELFVFEGKRSE